MQIYTPQCDRIILVFTTTYVSWGHGSEVNDLKVSGGLAVVVRARHQTAAGGAAAARANLIPWELQPHRITALPVPGPGTLVQTSQPCLVPWLGAAGWDFCWQRWTLPVLSSLLAPTFPC